MFNALWFNAQELNGTGQLYRVISLAASALPNIHVSTTPFIGLRIGLAATRSGGASPSVVMWPKRALAAAPMAGAVASPAIYMAPRRSMAAGVSTIITSFLGTSFRRNMAAGVSAGATAYFNSFSKFAAAVATNVHQASAPTLTRTLAFGAGVSVVTSRSAAPPSLKKFMSYPAKVTTNVTATPDVKVGGTTWWRLLAAVPNPTVKPNVTISPNTNLYSKVTGGANPGAATISKSQQLYPAQIFPSVNRSGGLSTRSYLYAVPAGVSAARTGTIFRTTAFRAVVATNIFLLNEPRVSYSYYLAGVASTSVQAVKPTLSFNIGMKSNSATATQAIATANTAWKFFAYATPIALPVAPVMNIADKLQTGTTPATANAKATAVVSMTVKPSILLAAAATVTMASNSASGYFTVRTFGATAPFAASQSATMQDIVRFGFAASVGAAATASMYINLFDLEPDFRTYFIDPEDWTDSVDTDDWTFTIVDDTTNMKNFTKQPGDVLGYDIDFTNWFAQIPTDSIQSASCSITAATDGVPSNLQIGQIVLVNDVNGVARIAKVWLSAGVSGTTYSLQLLMTSHEGRVKDVDFQMTVQEQ